MTDRVIVKFNKQLSNEKTFIWFESTTKAMLAYSYYNILAVKKWYGVPEIFINKKYSGDYWLDAFDCYEKIFGNKINLWKIDEYALGYKEDIEKEYTKLGNKTKAIEMTNKDTKKLSSELLKILTPNIKNGLEENILGAYVWQSHKQLVRPYLEKISKTK